MPNGFVGPPAASYLPKIEEALRVVAEVHSADPFANLRNWAVSPPAPPPRPNAIAPHPSSTAMTGSHMTGTGSVRNIVVDLDLYYNIFNKICQTDDKISEQMWHISKAIDEICGTTYVLPLAEPQCVRVSTTIGSSLVLFRVLTDEANSRMRKFKDETMSIQ